MIPETSGMFRDIQVAIEAYCKRHHRTDFDPHHPVVRLQEPTFSDEEIVAAVETLLSRQVIQGERVRNFESAFCRYGRFEAGVMVNSGSSANLLAVSALCNPTRSDALRPGDEVIVPALCWSTTIWPLVQHGLVPVIVDIDPNTLNIDCDAAAKAIGPKTRAVMPVHVYGNPCDMDALTSLCRAHGLFLIEDCCEASGALYRGRSVGSFSDIGTFSFHFSHHITTMEGGMCVTANPALADLLRILRSHGWVRDVADPRAWAQRHADIDPKFLFVNAGYNLRATEVQAAIGLVQQPKLDGFIARRTRNVQLLCSLLEDLREHLQFQLQTPNSTPSWFGFPLTVSPAAPVSVRDIRTRLAAAGIETRPIICGNIAAQPGLALFAHRTVGDLRHATSVMQRGFTFGNHHSMNDETCEYLADSLRAALRTA